MFAGRRCDKYVSVVRSYGTRHVFISEYLSWNSELSRIFHNELRERAYEISITRQTVLIASVTMRAKHVEDAVSCSEVESTCVE
jgi:hypothetical protein